MEKTRLSPLQRSPRPEDALLSNKAITSHLLSLGYPQDSLDSVKRCGEITGFKILAKCSHDLKIINGVRHCNLRVCQTCAKKRKRRIVRQYLPFLRKLPQDRKNFLYFLTISPKNYLDLAYGLDHLKKSWSKFIRHNYLKERIKGGFYVIESKGGAGDWNVHIHAIIYGRWIDNKVRKEQDSRIVRLFKQSSKMPVNIHVSRQGSSQFTLNYMCKYIGANKDDFNTIKDLAEYMVVMRKRRLVHSFGDFYNVKFKKDILICKVCFDKIEYIRDSEVINILIQNIYVPPLEQRSLIQE